MANVLFSKLIIIKHISFQWFTKHLIVNVSEKVPLPSQSNSCPRSWQRCLQRDQSRLYLILTWLRRRTQRWSRPTRIFQHQVGPSSRRADLCHTQQLRKFSHTLHIHTLHIPVLELLSTWILLTCARWWHLMFPNPVSPTRPICAGELPRVGDDTF